MHSSKLHHARIERLHHIARLGLYAILTLSVIAMTLVLRSSKTPIQQTKVRASEQKKKVYLLVFNPVIKDGKKLTTYQQWAEPEVITSQIINWFNETSNGRLQYEIVTRKEVDGIPVKENGQRYTLESYLSCLSNRANCISPDIADYQKILDEHQICEEFNAGRMDELWMWGAPWFGFYESRLAGRNAFSFNSPPLLTSGCIKLLPIMGFSYERSFSEAVHNFGHRMEDTMREVFGSWQQNNINHAWNKFGLVKKQSPNFSFSGCGSIHYPPNAANDYEYSNTTTVDSICDDFGNYPNLGDPNSTKKSISCTAWGCTSDGYYRWWMRHLPQKAGQDASGRLNDWWLYLIDPNQVLHPDPISPPPATKISCGDLVIDKSETAAVGSVEIQSGRKSANVAPGGVVRFVLGLKDAPTEPTRSPNLIAFSDGVKVAEDMLMMPQTDGYNGVYKREYTYENINSFQANRTVFQFKAQLKDENASTDFAWGTVANCTATITLLPPIQPTQIPTSILTPIPTLSPTLVQATVPPPQETISIAPESSPTPVPQVTVSVERVSIQLRVRPQGVLTDRPLPYNKLKVMVSVGGGSGSSVLLKNTEPVENEFVAVGEGIFEGTVSFDPKVLKPGTGYKIVVKAGKHLAKRFCSPEPNKGKQEPDGSYTCPQINAGIIQLKSGLNSFDFSKVFLPSGDLPINGKQDTVVDSTDFTYIRKKIPSEDPEILRIADINMDGVLDTQDYVLTITNLVNNIDEI
ncbi:MAG: hypothetical protein WCJ70_03100 [bacterium]